MRSCQIKIILILITSLVFLFSTGIQAEEGMWTFDNPPFKQLKEKFNFEPTSDWLEHVRLSSCKVETGSGSFISSTGLILTNHHVVRNQIQKMSTPGNDYIKNGFYAKTLADEIKCPDMDIRVLVSIQNVTGRVQKAAEGLKEKEAVVARKKEIARIEKENAEKTGLLSNVVVLYYGGEYSLYTFKKFKDIRLVFVPELEAARFGGDHDNFTYPRHHLDFAIFRAYENDKPANLKHYFKVNPAGLKENELVFVVGHPGTTSRLLTSTQLMFLKSSYYPMNIEHLRRSMNLLIKYSTLGQEQKRRATSKILSWQNSLKRFEGEYSGLQIDRNIKSFRAKEMKLQEAVDKDPQLKKIAGDSWEKIISLVNKYDKRYKSFFYTSPDEQLIDSAKILVFIAKESQKPNEERLSAYYDSQIVKKKATLLSKAPIYKDMQEVLLVDHFKEALEKLGPDDIYVKTILDGKTPEQRAKELVRETKLDDPQFRASLLQGGEEAILKSDDPLIKLALKLEPIEREMLRWVELEYRGPLNAEHEKIAQARFKVYGKNVYPDATGTLRISYGKVKGYPYNGTIAPYKTTFYGMFDRYYSFEGKDNTWILPKRYIDNAGKMSLATPLNFVSTADIIGGNSGSPQINSKGEIIGLIFDGNWEAQPGRYVYDDTSQRSISVSLAAIVEVLDKLYGANRIVDEMMK
jgi:hypothetical protein